MQTAQKPEHLTLLDKQRFTRIWKTLSTDFDPAHCDRVFEALSEFYKKPDRHYHTDLHIEHCLKQLDQAIAPDTMSPHLEMAIWCHDVIYTPGDPKNEKLSANWFKQQAESHITTTDIDTIVNLITITEHRNEPSSEIEKLMVDIDLSSLGLARKQFEEDGERVRKEFPEMSDREFIQGQIVFLENLIQRPVLYSTSYFHDNYEITARNNVNRLLTQYRTALMG